MENNLKDIAGGLSKLSKEQLLHRLLNTCLRAGFPLACWKLSGSDEIQVIVEFSHSLTPRALNLEKDSGFAISPFLNEDNQNTLLIRPDFYYNFKTTACNINENFENEKLVSGFLQGMNKPALTPFSLPAIINTANDRNQGKGSYSENVNQALLHIQKNDFKKVVLARRKEIRLRPGYSPAGSFLRLCREQSNSFVSLVHLPDQGIWLGASPELLIRVDKENIFHTTALAATQQFNEGDPVSKAVWTQKEIEEQALVSRYIISCFKTIRLREYEEDGPTTVRAGNLIHLKTDYSVSMNQVNFPDLGSVMLNLLHPTSAICGMPKKPALEFIEKHEEMHRKFYSGFLGPVNIEGESHIFVNIRCAEIGNEKAIVYSGAGITAESNPEKEFEETEIKMKTMSDVLISDDLPDEGTTNDISPTPY